MLNVPAACHAVATCLDGSHDALVAVASVAAVVWTGGFIVKTFPGKETTIWLTESMNWLQFAFLAPIFALTADPETMRRIAIGFLVLYVLSTPFTIRAYRNKPTTFFTFANLSRARAFRLWTVYTGSQLIVIVAVWPRRDVVAYLSAAAVYFGYQGLHGIAFFDKQPNIPTPLER